jgi:hypothetical protein
MTRKSRTRPSSAARLIEAGAATALAAATTIGHRTAMLAAAASDPAALGHPEFKRMGQEKIDAGLEVGAILGGRLALLPLHVASWWWSAATRGGEAVAAMALSRSPAELALAQQRYVSGLAASTRRLVEAAVGDLAAGLAPVHRVAAANARRLGSAR